MYKLIKIWDVNVDNIVISKLVKTKTNSKYLIGYLDEIIRPLVLILPKMSGYVKTYKIITYGDRVYTNFHDLNVPEGSVECSDDRYVKTKIRMYGDKVYTNFRGLNVPEGSAECKSFTHIYIHSLLVYENKYYLQLYWDSCAYKIVNTEMVDYLDDSLLETDED